MDALDALGEQEPYADPAPIETPTQQDRLNRASAFFQETLTGLARVRVAVDAMESSLREGRCSPPVWDDIGYRAVSDLLTAIHKRQAAFEIYACLGSS